MPSFLIIHVSILFYLFFLMTRSTLSKNCIFSSVNKLSTLSRHTWKFHIVSVSLLAASRVGRFTLERVRKLKKMAATKIIAIVSAAPKTVR